MKNVISANALVNLHAFPMHSVSEVYKACASMMTPHKFSSWNQIRFGNRGAALRPGAVIFGATFHYRQSSLPLSFYKYNLKTVPHPFTRAPQVSPRSNLGACPMIEEISDSGRTASSPWTLGGIK